MGSGGASRLRRRATSLAISTATVIVSILVPSVRAVTNRPGTPGPGAPQALTVDDLPAPLGVDASDVYFGWHLNDTRPDAIQLAYRIVVAGVWDSGRVQSADEAFVPYRGPALRPDTTYRWTVQTWDAGGRASPFSPLARFDTGLRDSDWRADWIKRFTVELQDSPSTFNLQSGFGVWLNKDEYTYARKEVRLESSPIVRARAYISADQQYELYVNGALAGKGQAYQYPDSQYYETWDVAGLLRPGARNAVGVLSNWQGPGKGRPAGTPGFIAHLSVLHRDGTVETITTDGSWKVAPGAWLPGTQRDEEGDPVDYTENINGLAEPIGWDQPGFFDLTWAPATVLGPHPTEPWTHLVSLRTRIVYEPVKAVSLTRLRTGALVADFGKVYAAIPTVTFHDGLPGRLVPMHAGFLLDKSGEVSTARGTQHTDMGYSYIQRGGVETFRPFDYLGFRYLQIDAPGESLKPGDVVALTRHTAVPDERAGTFASSNATVDAVFELGRHSALFTMQEQFVDTPTREKGSWLGDGRNESQTAMATLGDVNMTRRALLEFAQSQARFWPNGSVNKLYPTGLGAVEVPQSNESYPEWVWDYWMRTGDRATLTTLYPVVGRVSDYLWSFVSRADGLITNIAGDSDGPRFPTDTAINLGAVNVFARVATVAIALGRPAGEATRQQQRQAALTTAINAHLVHADGVYVAGLDSSGTQITTASQALNAASLQSINAAALVYGVVPPAHVATVERYVAGLGMATPPVSAGDMLEALRLSGDDVTLLHLLTDASEPGWANILSRGGTFGWEKWNPDDRDVPIGGTGLGSSFGNGDSMSHGFSSNVALAIQQALLGVVPTSPGFATFMVTPPAHVLDWAEGQVPTPFGPISVRWVRSPRFVLEVRVPPNTSAVVRFAGRVVSVGAGVYRFNA